MQYLLLIHDDEAHWGEMPEDVWRENLDLVRGALDG